MHTLPYACSCTCLWQSAKRIYDLREFVESFNSVLLLLLKRCVADIVLGRGRKLKTCCRSEKFALKMDHTDHSPAWVECVKFETIFELDWCKNCCRLAAKTKFIVTDNGYNKLGKAPFSLQSMSCDHFWPLSLYDKASYVFELF